jgi:hypothetical protein
MTSSELTTIARPLTTARVTLLQQQHDQLLQDRQLLDQLLQDLPQQDQQLQDPIKTTTARPKLPLINSK